MPESASTRVRVRDLAGKTVIRCAAFVVVLVFVLIVGNVLWQGWTAIDGTFLSESPRRSGRSGGIFSILISTLWILSICLLTAVPLGIATALYLDEYARPEGLTGRTIHVSLDVLAGVPSIVFGLFGNAFFAVTLGFGFSILSGGLTLACMALPLIIRATEEGFRAVPVAQRLSAASLGLSRTAILFRILLPAAWPGILVGVVLGIGRALAETAALIFTSGYVTRLPTSVLDSGRSLSIHIYDLAMNVPGGETNAYGTAVVLLALIVMVNLTASGMTRFWLAPPQSNPHSDVRRLV